MSERDFIRIGAISALLGGICAFVANVLHPRAPEYGNLAPFLQIIAESSSWVTVHIGIVLAILLMVGSLLSLGRSINVDRGAAWAQFGSASALVSASIGVVWAVVDGIAMKRVATGWVTAAETEKAVAIRVAGAIAGIEVGLFSIFIVVFFGITYLLFAVAVLTSPVYPKWLGRVAVIEGLAAGCVGLIQANGGLSVVMTNIFSPIVAVIATLWLMIMGAFQWNATRSGAGSSP